VLQPGMRKAWAVMKDGVHTWNCWWASGTTRDMAVGQEWVYARNRQKFGHTRLELEERSARGKLIVVIKVQPLALRSSEFESVPSATSRK